MGNFKKLGLLVVAILTAYLQYQHRPSTPAIPATSANVASTALDDAIARHLRDVNVVGYGHVRKVLADDREGSPHQKFLVELAAGETILIAHNTALAPRVPDLRLGTDIEFSGEYIWNERGGLVHWTHRDPRHQHADGYLKYGGRTYQ
jgi:hypothetical protein